METLVLDNKYKIVAPIFGAAPNKATTFLYWFRSLSTVLSPTENSRTQGLFKAFEWFSSTFQGGFNFQGLYKKAVQIQVLFKPVRTLQSYTQHQYFSNLQIWLCFVDYWFIFLKDQYYTAIQCIRTWYAMSRSLVKLMEIGTSCGRG